MTRDPARIDLPGLTLPPHLKGRTLKKVSFVPEGVCLKTGGRTKFGKNVYAPTSWSMRLVFDDEPSTDNSSAGELPVEDSKSLSKGNKTHARKQAKKAAFMAGKKALEDQRNEVLERLKAKALDGSLRAGGLDPGSKNIVTLAANVPVRPLAVKSSAFSGLNQFCSKEWARMAGEGNAGRDPSKEPDFVMTREMGELLYKRKKKFAKWCDLVASHVFGWIVENGIDCLFIGDGCKAKKEAGRMSSGAARQRFVQLPIARMTDLIRRKCEAFGIPVFDVSEAFTSASSFLDNEPLPDLSCGKTADELRKDGVFGARREKGRLILRDGTQIHSDVNGALNIMSRGLFLRFGVKTDGRAFFAGLTRRQGHEYARPVSTRVCRMFPRRGFGAGEEALKQKACGATSPGKDMEKQVRATDSRKGMPLSPKRSQIVSSD